MKNKYTVYHWVKKVILSCKTIKHYIASRKLISNYLTMYGDYQLYGSLINISEKQYKKIKFK